MQRGDKTDPLRALPAVSRVLGTPRFAALIRRYGADLVTALVRERLGEIRGRVLAGELDAAETRRAVGLSRLAGEVSGKLAALLAPRPRSVINGTGVIVHTNLGRSVLSREAAGEVARVARGYVDLEFDLATGRRGSRGEQLAPLLRHLFPGCDALVLNNNAAATMLALRALARGREVLISRGELVEIGGSFRVPDILEVSGARLHEVGTTNRTRIGDYRRAVSRRTGAILKVHTSNFRIVGFTEEPKLAQLVELAGERRVPLIVDWGSGDLVDLGPVGIHDEIPVRQILDAGADLVTFSGDKLLGGPQAGFAVGRPERVARLREDPLARVCRIDRVLTAAIHRTLSAYVRGCAFEEVPTLRMLAAGLAEIGRRAEALRRRVRGGLGAGLRRRVTLDVIDGVSRTGGGSSPTGERTTRLLTVALDGRDAGGLDDALRQGRPPVVGRVQDGRLLLDLRTVDAREETALARALIRAIQRTA